MATPFNIPVLSGGAPRQTRAERRRASAGPSVLPVYAQLATQIPGAPRSVPNLLGDVRGATLGLPADPRFAPRHLQNVYAGWGTSVNTGQNFFGATHLVPIDGIVAGLLNQKIPTVAAATEAIAAANPGVPVSYGLGGTLQGGGFGLYSPGVNAYLPDPKAEIKILKVLPGSNIPGGLSAAEAVSIGMPLPGSLQQAQLLLQGRSGAGQVRVESPQNRTGRVAVGSDKWIGILQGFVGGTVRAHSDNVEHLVAQGAVYGLGPVFDQFGYTIAVQLTPQGNARYSLENGTLEELATNEAFIDAVRNWYTDFGVDPANQQKGLYGAASLMKRHASRMNLTASGAPADPAAVAAAADQMLAQGSVGGFHWADNYGDHKNRYGLTAFPMVDVNGNPVADPSNRNAGKCMAEYSSALITQGAANKFGVRTVKRGKRHLSTAKGAEGVALGHDTYSCALNSGPSDILRTAFQAGGQFATAQRGFADALQERQAAMPADIAAEYSPAAMASDYVQRATNFTYGVGVDGARPGNLFMWQPDGSGFSKNAPNLWANRIQDPQTREAFRRASLPQLSKIVTNAPYLNPYTAVARGEALAPLQAQGFNAGKPLPTPPVRRPGAFATAPPNPRAPTGFQPNFALPINQ